MTSHDPALHFDTLPSTALSLRRAGSEAISVPADSATAAAIALFRQHVDLEILPALDADGRPIGALLERSIRPILYNPYGHALLQNRTFVGELRKRLTTLPIADVDDDIGRLLAIHGGEGLILTRDGRYCGVIENRALVRAATLDQAARLAAREAELAFMARASAGFEADIGRYVSDLARLSADLGQRAADTAGRGRSTGLRGIAVAAAAEQASQSLGLVASRGGELFDALGKLHHETIASRNRALEAERLVTAGSERADSLFTSAVKIDEATGLVDALAARVRMLAINATIEAARAGDAGRSFAVVAAEVRALADQTKHAAGRIRGHTSEVQAAAREAAEGQTAISQIVAGVARLSASVDHAVEAQRALMRGITDGVDQAATMSNDVRASVAAISEASGAAADGAAEMEEMAGALAAMSIRIRDRSRSFLDQMA